MICRRRILKLLYVLFFFVSCAVVYNSYTKKQTQAPYCLGTRKQPWLPPDVCQDIKNTIAISEVKKFNPDELIEQVEDLQSCQWTGNATALRAVRSELHKCCDAVRNLLVTQENTHIGDNITYETQKHKHIEVTEEIHKMFPKTSLFSNKPIRSCVVVGNGGILLNSCCGSEIDQADYVFRFNLPPMNFANDTGTKTNLVTANPSIVTERYARLHERRRPFMDLVKTFEPAPILMAAFSYPSTTDVIFKVFYTLEEFGSKQAVIYFHPNYLTNLGLYWKTKGLAGQHISSGFIIVSMALEICDKVTLYGFWPFDEDTDGNPIPHHYYDNRLPKLGIHSMPSEFFFYSQMHSKGILKLKVGRCF
uniref:Uncharacterized protein n=1 Tax=Leptobrachium leishanense TaxID=445787 RepID=A0A8C5M6F0_9ANUR